MNTELLLKAKLVKKNFDLNEELFNYYNNDKMYKADCLNEKSKIVTEIPRYYQSIFEEIGLNKTVDSELYTRPKDLFQISFGNAKFELYFEDKTPYLLFKLNYQGNDIEIYSYRKISEGLMWINEKIRDDKPKNSEALINSCFFRILEEIDIDPYKQ